MGLDTCLPKSLSLGTRLLCILVTGLKFPMNRCQLHLGNRASPVNQALIQTTQCGKVLFFCAIHKEVEVTIAYPSKVASLYEAGRLGGLGPVSRKSRNFTGHFWVSQFLVYLKNGESSELHIYFSFCSLDNTLKDRLSKTSGLQFHKRLFGPKTFSGLSRNGPLAR